MAELQEGKAEGLLQSCNGEGSLSDDGNVRCQVAGGPGVVV